LQQAVASSELTPPELLPLLAVLVPKSVQLV